MYSNVHVLVYVLCFESHILPMFSHIHVYMLICVCEGGFNTPTKHLNPLTQKSWFIKHTQLKELHQLLTKNLSSTVNLVNIAKVTNVSVKIIENLHRHLRGTHVCLYACIHNQWTICDLSFIYYICCMFLIYVIFIWYICHMHIDVHVAQLLYIYIILLLLCSS